MSNVLIVSRTQMKNGVCVGAIDINNCELVRLHNSNGGNLAVDAPYQVGEIWEVQMQTAWNVRHAPHVEDKQTTPIKKIDNIGINGIINFINTHYFGSRLTRGDLQNTFEGCLNLQGRKNFINRENVPPFSTQFWIADEDLIHSVQFNTHYYLYKGLRLRFVGFQEPVERITAGTIIRLSLANWWDGDSPGEDRCYLQLSGWY